MGCVCVSSDERKADGLRPATHTGGIDIEAASVKYNEQRMSEEAAIDLTATAHALLEKELGSDIGDQPQNLTPYAAEAEVVEVGGNDDHVETPGAGDDERKNEVEVSGIEEVTSAPHESPRKVTSPQAKSPGGQVTQANQMAEALERDGSVSMAFETDTLREKSQMLATPLKGDDAPSEEAIDLDTSRSEPQFMADELKGDQEPLSQRDSANAMLTSEDEAPSTQRDKHHILDSQRTEEAEIEALAEAEPEIEIAQQPDAELASAEQPADAAAEQTAVPTVEQQVSLPSEDYPEDLGGVEEEKNAIDMQSLASSASEGGGKKKNKKKNKKKGRK